MSDTFATGDGRSPVLPGEAARHSSHPINSLPRFRFEAGTHTYFLDNQVIPGVTATLKAAGIVDYSMIPQTVLERAWRRGALAHEAMYYYALDTLDLASLDPQIEPYVMAGIRFHEESRLVAARVEERAFNDEYRYAGTPDLEAVIGGDPWLIDYKTGLVLPGHRHQLAAYLNLDCFKSPRRYRRAILQLCADGTYRLHEYLRAEYARDLEVFLLALEAQRRKGFEWLQ